VHYSVRNFILLTSGSGLGASVADPDPGFEIRDPVLFYPLDPGSGSGMNFFWIPDLWGMFFGEIFLRILVL
jgi:hypothetical protein